MYDLRRCPDLAELATEACGVVDLDQCRQHGLRDEQLWWLVESGRWQSPYPRVYVTFSGPIHRDTQLEAALAYAGEGAVLGYETAGAAWNLCPWPDEVHVIVPYKREVEDQQGVTIHRSRTLSEEDIHPTRRPRCLRIEPTVLTMLRNRRTADSALGLVADAVRSRQTTTERLRAAVKQRSRTRWRAQVLIALPDVAAGAHSLLELHDAKMRRRHGLPSGRRQKRRRRDGTEFLDVVIAEYRLHVELDGRLGHDRAQEIWRDMRRDNASVVGLMRHLRYGWSDMLGDPCGVAIQQATVLRQQGWTGAFRACPNCPPELPSALSC